MNKKKLKHAFNDVIAAAESLNCEDLHHKKSQRHESGHLCFAEYALHRNIFIVKEYMKEQGVTVK